MRKIYYSIAILFCFQLYQEGFAQEQERLNFCELFSSSQYNERTVITEAVLYISPGNDKQIAESADEYFYSKNCNNRDYFALADFSKANNLQLLLKESNKFPNQNSPKIYLVTFEGKFSISLPPKYGHLSFLRAKFEINGIKSAKAITFSYGLPDMNSDAPMIETANSLSEVDLEVMFSLFGRGFNDYEPANLLTSDTKITIDEKPINNADYLKVNLTKKSGTLEHRISDITQNGSEWNVKGHIVNKSEDNSVTKIIYDNKYLLQKDNSWKLITLKANSLSND